MKEDVQKALDEIRPGLQADGGDVELVDVNDGVVKVKLVGACGSCPMSQMTLKMGIEEALKAKLPEVKDEHLPALRLWARLIVTLDMILRDPNQDVIIRKDKKEDFIAAIRLLEKVTLPLFYGIQLHKNLFENYEEVEPIIGWESFIKENVN